MKDEMSCGGFPVLSGKLAPRWLIGCARMRPPDHVSCKRGAPPKKYLLARHLKWIKIHSDPPNCRLDRNQSGGIGKVAQFTPSRLKSSDLVPSKILFMNLIQRIENRQATVAVIGLGYVGLPLVLGFCDSGFHVLGLDIDAAKTDSLAAGCSYIDYIPAGRIQNARAKQLLEVSVDFARVSEVDAIIICVPTPIGQHHEPDLSYIVSTMDAIIPHLRKGQLLCLESTTYPGSTKELLQDRLAALGFKAGEDMHFVFSPEREDPGNQVFSGHKIAKLVGGATASCLAAGLALYGAVFDTVVPVASTQVAEFAKLLENTFRAVNIGLVNELKMVADRMGIDIWEVIQAAATKPFGFTPFYPGPGVGGHCIPVDPFYLTWKAKEFGLHTRFVELAAEINESMPLYVVEKVAATLNERGQALNGSRVLVLGLAFKADVQDVRGSPSFEIMDLLGRRFAHVDYHDPHVPEVPPTREHGNWRGKRSIELSEGNLHSYDCIVIATAHSVYEPEFLARSCRCIIDTRNFMSGVSAPAGLVTKA
jgi:UDP-N-acetyl-D-glucosamine dehydrogenase